VPTGSVVKHAVQVLNPSLIDFLHARLADDPDAVKAVLGGAPYFDQVRWMADRLIDKGALDGEVVPLLVSAINRTVNATAPTPVARPDNGHPLGRSADRLLAIVGWVKAEPQLLTLLGDAPDALLKDVMRSADHTTGYGLQLCVSLIRPLDAAGYATRRLAASLKRRIGRLGSSLATLEAARDLRDVAPDAYGRHEWEQVAREFSAWQGFALDDPTSYFDDLDELDRVLSLAEHFGHELDESRLDEARERVEEARDEAAERALEDVEPDERREDDGAEPPIARGVDDTDYIDAIFNGLRE
jgi:hypothetical protein